jgi:hypothetical protein
VDDEFFILNINSKLKRFIKEKLGWFFISFIFWNLINKIKK